MGTTCCCSPCGLHWHHGIMSLLLFGSPLGLFWHQPRGRQSSASSVLGSSSCSPDGYQRGGRGRLHHHLAGMKERLPTQPPLTPVRWRLPYRILIFCKGGSLVSPLGPCWWDWDGTTPFSVIDSQCVYITQFIHYQLMINLISFLHILTPTFFFPFSTPDLFWSKSQLFIISFENMLPLLLIQCLFDDSIRCECLINLGN